MAKELTHFIGGKHVKGTSGRFTDAYQPMTGDVISKVPLASRAEMRAAVENAKAAQPAWAATNPQRRRSASAPARNPRPYPRRAQSAAHPRRAIPRSDA